MKTLRRLFASREVRVALIVAAVTALVTTLVTVGGEWLFKRTPDADLQVVAVTLTAPPDATSEVLDVQLRNVGDRAAVIKEVTLTVLRRWQLRPSLVLMKGLSPSAKYLIVLPVMDPVPYSVTTPLAHAVSSDGVDRILLNVVAFGRRYDFEHHVCLTKVTFVYNETNEKAEYAAAVVIASGPRISVDSMYLPPPPIGAPGSTFFSDYREAAPLNVAAAREINALPVTKSPFATALVNAVIQGAKGEIK